MRINEERAARNFEKVRLLAHTVVGELNHFHVFVNRSFETPNKAFDLLAGGSDVGEATFEKFTQQLERLQFTGRSDRVFFALCEDPRKQFVEVQGLVVRRHRFLQRLSSRRPPLQRIVDQLIATRSVGSAGKLPKFEAAENDDASTAASTPCSTVAPVMGNSEGKGRTVKRAGLRRSGSLDSVPDALAAQGLGMSEDTSSRTIKAGVQPKKRRNSR